MKNQKGITLIALVITIIVLLILAGVSIALLTGENGLLSRAQQAGSENLKGQLEEAIKLAVAESTLDKYMNTTPPAVTIDSLVAAVEKTLGTDFTITGTAGTPGTIKAVKGSEEATIKVTITDGKVTNVER